MNFKIEINFIDITSYPTIEKHFEDMARRGWLIHTFVLESIFIYKKIEPKELDFSISLYEVETAFTKKTKEEFEEFKSVCESVGWNYASKLGDLHIYFKEKGSEAIDLATDDEVTFDTIERIAKKQLRGIYFSIPIMIIAVFPLLLGWFGNAYMMRNGMVQLIMLFFPLSIALSIFQVSKIKGFLKENKKNIEIGNKIEYRKSNFHLERTMQLFEIVFLLVFISYSVYVGIILKNSRQLAVIIPIAIGMAVGNIDRIVVKPARISSGIKKVIFAVSIIAIVIVVNVLNIDKIARKYNNLDIGRYKVLDSGSFGDIAKVYSGPEEKVLQDISILVPKSYEYSYFDEDDVYISTEYSNTLNEDIAKNLVNMYKIQSKHQLEQYEFNLEMAMEEDNYKAYEEAYSYDSENRPEDFPKEKTLEELGLSLEEFQKIDKSIIRKAVKEGIKILESKAIKEDKEKLWDLDEVYFLNYEKTEVVIRKGKEVFYLSGKDFSEPDTIEIAKNRLGL